MPRSLAAWRAAPRSGQWGRILVAGACSTARWPYKANQRLISTPYRRAVSHGKGAAKITKGPRPGPRRPVVRVRETVSVRATYVTRLTWSGQSSTPTYASTTRPAARRPTFNRPNCAAPAQPFNNPESYLVTQTPPARPPPLQKTYLYTATRLAPTR